MAELVKEDYIPKKISMTLDKVAGRYWEEQASKLKSGVRFYQPCIARIREFFGKSKPFHEIDDNELAQFVSWLLRQKRRTFNHKTGNAKETDLNLQPAHVNRILSVFSAMYNRAKNIWRIEVGECYPRGHFQQTRGDLTNFLSVEQYKSLLKNAPEYLQNQLIFLLNTGVRVQNMLDLQWHQVDLDSKQIALKTKSRKIEGKTHIIPINKDLFSLLTKLWLKATQEPYHPDNEKRPSGHVFLNKGMPIKDSRKAMKTAMEKAGIEQTRGQLFHLLRHTAASWIIKNGGDIYEVKETLGHKSINTSLKYAHMEESRKRSAVDRLSFSD